MTLHEFIILMTLPIGTSSYNEIQMILLIGTSRYNIRYTSEYISKLPIHQHSLLTRKVFTVHQHKSSSLEDHQSWIITGSSSSSLLLLYRANDAISQFYSPQEVLQSQPFFMMDVGLASMQVFIYSANPFSCWMQSQSFSRYSSTVTSLFHVGCRPSPLLGLNLQCQPFFMLDAILVLYRVFIYSAIHFSCRM